MPSSEVLGSKADDPPDQLQAAVLVDFDNLFPGAIDSAEQVSAAIERMIDLVLRRWPEAAHVEVRLYGGWLLDGVLTNRASELHASLARGIQFPIPHPAGAGILRGSVGLATRLVAVPEIEWTHTLRQRSGLPRVSLASPPYPEGCVHESSDCPVKALQRLARGPLRECQADGCRVTNHSAFRVPEQKMVDVMLACDAIELARRGWSIVIASSDLDVLPAAAMAANGSPGRVALLRSARSAAPLYEAELARLQVGVDPWEAQ
jgi:hypothetical protein